ncbi:GUN4 domain-containing protein [Cylindrospermopsis raciborskii]|uniref:GUN4 domain-containing protein n=1 Tax=Cylindrospermopsis raciborskii TaxID=77022 RepID=UPI0021557C2D|nr:GUN4 domain-containing protein [Cylindrospermopsis raciborskii]
MGLLRRRRDRVGWRKQDSWLNYNDLNFSLSAETGHLPVRVVARRVGCVMRWVIRREGAPLPSCQDM